MVQKISFEDISYLELCSPFFGGSEPFVQLLAILIQEEMPFKDVSYRISFSVRLFADDCVLYRNKYSIHYCLTLKEDLTSLGQWEADWQMKFNVAKCHSMRVTWHQHHKHILFD